MNDYNLKFMIKACKSSYNSTCYKRNIGAILVKDNTILSYGYNGAKPCYIHCKGDSELSLNYCYWKKKAYDRSKQIGLDISTTEYVVLKREFRALCLSSCAERLAIRNAINSNKDVKNSILYCTTFPCTSCAKAIRDYGISKVYYINEFYEELPTCVEAKRILDECNIIQVQVECPKEYVLQGKRTTY